jgi:protein SCO1/2
MFSRRALVTLAFAGLALAACDPKPRPNRTVSSGPADIGGPFSLVDQNGKPATEAILKGKWSVIYFGYTYCPDVCPTSLQTLAAGLDKMGAKGADVQTILISVDPARDTPAQLKAYVKSEVFPKNLIGLTGTPEQVAAAAKAYKFYFKKAGDGPDYLVDHLSIMYLMDPNGNLDRPLTHGQTPDEIATQIRDAMKNGPRVAT